MFKKKEDIKINPDLLNDIENKVVLVTGAGGQVGSALCKELNKANPKKLIALDIVEQNLEKIDAIKLLGSTYDMDRINEIFKIYKPDIIFHCAGYRDDKLIEDSPCEAVKVNILGTYNVAHAAKQNGAQTFIFISTYNNTTSVLDSTIKITEQMIEGANHYKDTCTCEIYHLTDQTLTKQEPTQLPTIDTFTFNLQTLVIAARTNDDNKTKYYIDLMMK